MSQSNKRPLCWWEAPGITPPTVYNVNDSREFSGTSLADPSPLEPGIWLVPRNGYLDRPPKARKGYALCRNADGLGWDHVVDHRGQLAYRTVQPYRDPVLGIEISPGQSMPWPFLGELPTGWTFQAPDSKFSAWRDGKWVSDRRAESRASRAIVEAGIADRLRDASLQMVPLEDALALGQATEQERALFLQWTQYRIDVTRVRQQPGFPTDITWPEIPGDR